MDSAELSRLLSPVLIERFKSNILGRAFGNYSKSYEFYQRISNIEHCFLRAVNKSDKSAVLDVGCGDGYHACLLNSLPGVREKVSITGIDPVSLDIRTATLTAESLQYDNVRFLQGSADKLDFQDSGFDIVLCSDVIEHLPDPEQCLREIKRVLKPGGTMILTTPNDTSAVKALLNALRNRQSAMHGIDDDHISVKGLGAWLALVRKTGFRVTDIRRGALIFGGDKVNKHPVLFAAALVLDRIFNILPFTKNWCEAITLNGEKQPAR